jgi:hypothetical protein
MCTSALIEILVLQLVPWLVQHLPLLTWHLLQDATATTLAIQCAEGTDCGFPAGASVIVGPSTFHATYTGPEGGLTIVPDCKIFGSPSATSADCEQTFIGQQDFITAPGAETRITTGDATMITSSTASGSFGASDIAEFLVPITITAGSIAGNGAAQSEDTVHSATGGASAPESGAAASATGSGSAQPVDVGGIGMTRLLSAATALVLALL